MSADARDIRLRFSTQHPTAASHGPHLRHLRRLGRSHQPQADSRAVPAVSARSRLPTDTRIVGFSRTAFTHDAWRTELAETVAKFAGNDFDAGSCGTSSPQRIFYHPGDIGQRRRFRRLWRRFSTRSKRRPTARASTTWPPRRSSTNRPSSSSAAPAWPTKTAAARRVIIEKPFGTDLASAKQLNEVVHAVFSEQQVYRIDHYLGKETVQNLLVLRFANTIFEPIWNRNYIDHVQITVAEEVDVGSRAGYYDTAGVVRDMFQNHLLQLLMITAMEAPVRYEADAVRDEKVKVLQAIRPLTAEQVARRHAPRPVSRLSRRTKGVAARQPHRHVRRDQAVDRQLALAGRAVLSAQRQGDVVPHDADRHPVPRAAAHAVRRRAAERRRVEPAGHSGAAGRRHSAPLSKPKCPTPA